MKAKLFILSAIIVLNIRCSKDGKGCWQGFTPSGADVFDPPLCDITKKQAEEKYPNVWFYRNGEAKLCWKATKPGDPAYLRYVWGIPESMKGNMENTHGYKLTKIDCSNFCNLGWAEKHKSKVTGQIVFITGYDETLLSADSCGKLAAGRIITLWQTTDSIAYLELVNRYP